MINAGEKEYDASFAANVEAMVTLRAQNVPAALTEVEALVGLCERLSAFMVGVGHAAGSAEDALTALFGGLRGGAKQSEVLALYRVLLLSYEAMKADLPACVARVASHLGLAPSAELMATCLSRMDFAWMKANEERFAPRSVAWLDKGDGFSFVRQGKVGGGKLDLSAEQREAIERSCWRADDRWSALVGEGAPLSQFGRARKVVLRGIGPRAGA